MPKEKKKEKKIELFGPKSDSSSASNLGLEIYPSVLKVEGLIRQLEL